jgi:hypothetical protein
MIIDKVPILLIGKKEDERRLNLVEGLQKPVFGAHHSR